MKALIKNSCIAIAVLGVWSASAANAHPPGQPHSNGHHNSSAHSPGYRGYDKHHKSPPRQYLVKKHYQQGFGEHRRDSYQNRHLNDYRGIIYIKPFAFYLHNTPSKPYYRDSRHHARGYKHYSRDYKHYSRHYGHADNHRHYANRH